MIFARDLSDPLASLAKKIDAATDKNSECKMGSFIVFLNDDEGIDKKLKELADKEHLEKISLATMSKNKCQASYAFKKGELTDSDVDKIVTDLTKILPEK
jgi:hypothetical protein